MKKNPEGIEELILQFDLERIFFAEEEEEEEEPSIVASLRDITEQKLAERKLRESHQLLEQTFASLHDAVFIIDAETDVVASCNLAASNIFGYSKKELLGQPIASLYIDKANFEEFRRNLNTDVEEKGYLTNFEFQMKRKDGAIFPTEHHKTPLLDVDGKLSSWVSVIRDISQRKQAEEKIKASLKEKKVLLREIHHRVKNNMHVIIGLLELQSDYIRDEKVLNVFSDCRNRIRSMALVHEKLYQSEELARINISDYIETVVMELFRLYNTDIERINFNLKAKNIYLNINTAIPCGLIINELISNSLKHAFPDNRKGEIEVSLSRSNTNKITLKINDNGIGIPYDLNMNEIESLGLKLVQILAEDQLGGSIKLDRSDGTKFILYFELRER